MPSASARERSEALRELRERPQLRLTADTMCADEHTDDEARARTDQDLREEVLAVLVLPEPVRGRRPIVRVQEVERVRLLHVARTNAPDAVFARAEQRHDFTPPRDHPPHRRMGP